MKQLLFDIQDQSFSGNDLVQVIVKDTTGKLLSYESFTRRTYDRNA